jgi:hypothetical protein
MYIDSNNQWKKMKNDKNFAVNGFEPARMISTIECIILYFCSKTFVLMLVLLIGAPFFFLLIFPVIMTGVKKMDVAISAANGNPQNCPALSCPTVTCPMPRLMPHEPCPKCLESVSCPIPAAPTYSETVEKVMNDEAVQKCDMCILCKNCLKT